MATVLETAIRSVVTKGIYLLADFNRMRLGWSKTPHPYLTGIHQPMTDEKTLTELAVTGLGEMPAVLSNAVMTSFTPRGRGWGFRRPAAVWAGVKCRSASVRMP